MLSSVSRPKKKNVLQKLFTRRKNSLTLKSSNSPANRGAVFGNDLADLEGPGTPKYLHEWYNYLLRHGLKTRGLFRKPGENNLVKKLRDMYDREETFDLATEVGGTGESSVHCVASLLKLFFRETKVPLFPEARNDIISELSKQSDEPNVIHLLGQAVALFPKSRQNIIKDLFLFLQKVSQHMDTNLMSPNNLALCFTPSLFQTKFQTLEDLQALKPLTAMTAEYIQFADKISFAGRRASTSANRSNVPAMAKPRAQSMQIASCSGHLEQPDVLKARANSDTNDAKASREYVSGAKLTAAGWETKKTGDGRVFFFHRAQQRSSWSADGLVKCWIQVVNNNGKTYYYHSHTLERRWNKPDLYFS